MRTPPKDMHGNELHKGDRVIIHHPNHAVALKGTIDRTYADRTAAIPIPGGGHLWESTAHLEKE